MRSHLTASLFKPISHRSCVSGAALPMVICDFVHNDAFMGRGSGWVLWEFGSTELIKCGRGENHSVIPGMSEIQRVAGCPMVEGIMESNPDGQGAEFWNGLKLAESSGPGQLVCSHSKEAVLTWHWSGLAAPKPNQSQKGNSAF